MAFDAFISYSHAGDGHLAPALQRGLQQLAKPWSRRQALRIFRDDTGLSVNPALWKSITEALDDSQYFVLLASPGAAQSEWVNREITYWRSSRPDAAERILPVVTAGTWAWDEATGDIDWAGSTAAPAALAGAFVGEPRHLDLVWAQSQDDLDLRNTRFRDAVADLAAPIHGIPKDELESEDVRQHRRAVRLRRAAVGALGLLVVGLAVAGILAMRSADAAQDALSDLEDANGNIDQLTAEGAALEAANATASADLASTEAARDEAELLAAEATERAAAADAARESAEAAQAEAEEAQLEAEDARRAAVEAQTTAERDRDAAAGAAAVAAEAEAEARRQEDAARAGEQAALDAEAEAVAASQAAAVAEAQARAGEQAASDAAAEAGLKETQARQAEAAAQAGERLALAAEAEALAAEAEALAAQDAALAAEQAARAAEQAARAAEVAATEAAASAQQRRQEAEAAALAASLAQAASEQSDPVLNALLSVESYCAVRSCEGAEQPQSLHAAAPLSEMTNNAASPFATAGQVPPAVPSAPFAAVELDALLTMVNSLSTHQDVLGPLPGWSGRAIDVAVSADGGTIAAVRDDGTVRVWHPGAPGGQDLAIRAIGVAVSDDGTSVGYVTAGRKFRFTGAGAEFFGALEGIGFVTFTGSPAPSGAILVDDDHATPHSRAELSFAPGSNDVVLVNFAPRGIVVFDRAQAPAVSAIDRPVAAWIAPGELAVFDLGEAFTALPSGAKLRDIENPHIALPTAVTSAGDRVVVGYEDGSLGTVALPALAMEWRRAHAGSVEDVAVGPDGLTAVTSASDGSVRRIRVAEGSFADSPATDVTVRPTGRTDLASARNADLLVVAVDGRLERRTVSPSWAGSYVRSGVTGRPASTGALIVPRDGGGYELASPDGTLVNLPNAAASGVVSADASTVLFGWNPLLVVPINTPSKTVALAFGPGESLFDGRLALSANGATAAAVRAFPGRVVTFNGRTGEVLGEHELPSSHGPPARVVDLLVSDEAVVYRRQEIDKTGRVDDVIIINRHDGNAGRLIRVLGQRAPMYLTSGPAGVLYVAGPDGIVSAYPVAGGAGVEVLDVGPLDPITAIGTEPTGGELIVLGYASGRVELWNMTTGVFITELSRHGLPVAHAVIGQTAAGLRVTTTAELPAIGSEAVVRTIDDPDLLRRALCGLSGRDLNEAEWHRFVGVGDPRSCVRGLS